MSTNKTPNYQLHSWVPSDEFHLAEINENFAALDGAVAGKADAPQLAAVQTALDKKAEMIHGTYIGTGSNVVQTIELGFQPKAVLVFSYSGAMLSNMCAAGMAVQNTPMAGSSMVITETGFQVTYGWCNLNDGQNTYIYLALR